jgi:hypothetical protein
MMQRLKLTINEANPQVCQLPGLNPCGSAIRAKLDGPIFSHAVFWRNLTKLKRQFWSAHPEHDAAKCH